MHKSTPSHPREKLATSGLLIVWFSIKDRDSGECPESPLASVRLDSHSRRMWEPFNSFLDFSQKEFFGELLLNLSVCGKKKSPGLPTLPSC